MDEHLLIPLDYPDPDIIRVQDKYYMVTTTMHFMPGGEILQSDDLLQWEHCSYLFEDLEKTPAHSLMNGQSIYGQGMWAASLRAHLNVFYCVFSANESQTTYVFTAKNIEGPWKKGIIEGFYHDPSLFFEGDRVYLIYGNSKIFLQEIEADDCGFKRKSEPRLLVSEKNNSILGYEGSHFYKINDRYYLFLIHSSPEKWKRIQACFSSNELEGPYTGKDIFDSDLGFLNQGVAQGGLVDTPTGEWYTVMFQDRGAVGRLPVLLKVEWENQWPVIQSKMQVADQIAKRNEKLVSSDNFDKRDRRTQSGLHPKWQFNHRPMLSAFRLNTENKQLEWTSVERVTHFLEAKNTLTQRLRYPDNMISVVIDASEINEGDFTGIAILQEKDAWLGVTKEKNHYFACMCEKQSGSGQSKIIEKRLLTSAHVTLHVSVQFQQMKDEACFYVQQKNQSKQMIGTPQLLFFSLAHFTGNRVALFYFSTRILGGKSIVKQFTFH